MSTYLKCVNCGQYINAERTAYDVIKLADGKKVHSHYHACTHQYFTYGEAVGHVVETVNQTSKEFK